MVSSTPSIQLKPYQDIEYYHRQRKSPYALSHQSTLYTAEATIVLLFVSAIDGFCLLSDFMVRNHSMYSFVRFLLHSTLFLRFIHVVIATIDSFSLPSSSVLHSLFTYFSGIFFLKKDFI